MKPQQIFMKSLGRFYERLYRLPGLGEPLVRGITRNLGRIAFYSPLTSLKRLGTIAEIRKVLESLTALGGIPIEIVKEDADSLEFLVNRCPYGYSRRDQFEVCDAAMDMDRYAARLCGADLTIRESVVTGAPKCRILIRRV